MQTHSRQHPRRHMMPASALFTALLVAVTAPVPHAAATWSAGASQPVPHHHRAWEEEAAADPRTVLHWSFSTDEDRGDALEALLDSDDFLMIPATGPVLEPATTGQAADTPRLEGDAEVAAGRGKLGGGLVVSGHGFAQGNAPLAAILNTDSGFTLDFWFRADALPEPEAPALLAQLAGIDRKPLLTLQITAEQMLELVTGDATVRLRMPVRMPPRSWHHLTLALNTAGRLTLMVDERVEQVPAPHTWERGEHSLSRDLRLLPANPVPDWTLDVRRRIGSELSIGGARGQAGLHGIIDEVRLSRGIRHYYRWHLGTQERGDAPPPPDPAAPYFRGSSLLTRLRFDGTLKPEALAGRDASGRDEAARFQTGIQGQALDLSRIGEAGFTLHNLEIPPERDGSIEFWFRPLDWHNFFRGDYHGTDLPRPVTLMQLEGSGVTRPVQVHRGTAGANANLPWFRIHPGAWTHVLLVFKNGGQAKYLNGQRTRYDQVWLFPRAGEGPWSLRFMPSPTLVDEFSVYPWAMNEQEAWNAYARWLPDAAEQLQPLPHFEVHFSYVAHSWNLQERLRATVTCLSVEGRQPALMDFELHDTDGTILHAVSAHALDASGQATLTIERTFPFGRYPATVRSRTADGTLVAETSVTYERERPAWYETPLGRERTVPAPWQPMTVENGTIELVGRTLELGAGGLPAQIVTLGRAILEAPVALRVATGAGAGTLMQGRGVTVNAVAPDRVNWTGTSEGGGLTARIDAWMEFDGLLYCNVTLHPAAGAREARVDSLQVEFPMPAARARQLIANGGGSNFRRSWLARYVPDGSGSVWNSGDQPYPAFTRAIGLSNFMPHIWIGDDAAGLYFGGDNDRGWTVGGEHPAQEILRTDNTVTFRMNVIREPLTIAADGHAFHFVILPTPAKPEPEDWRHNVTRGGYSFGSMDSFGGHCMKTNPDNPEAGDSFRLKPSSWDHATAMAQASRARWGQCILYADASWPRPGPSFADWNHDLWAGTGRIAWTPEFEDYVVWVVNEYLERGLIDGIYFDDVSVGHTFSLASTAYPFEQAEQGRRIGFTALAQRRVLMRLWRLFLAHGKDPGISVHMTYCYEVPVFSFSKYIYNAEIFSGVSHPNDRDAMDEWPAARMRILAGAAKWGAGHPFISTLPRGFTGMDDNWVYRQVRTEDAAFISADVPGAAAPWGALAAVFAREGVFDAGVRGFPFWASDALVEVDAPDGAQINTAVYAHDNRAILFVANRDREEREVVLRLKDGALFDGAPALDWRDIDPGLKPPASAVAGANELKALRAGPEVGLIGEAAPLLDDDALLDMIEGTTPQERALERLQMQVEDNRVRVVIRPRDYRVLLVRPRPQP